MSNDESGRPSVLSSSAVMAAGTVVSRLSGFVRGALLAAALGQFLHAELFTIANTIPNMLYILLAGGIFNAVLVPQLVRAIERDPDGGERYTNLVITVAALFLAGVTAILVIFAPLLMQVFLSEQYFTPEYDEHRASIIDLARYCLPQVFFYGMFVLVGQILNARGRFGPMMWAPIANNLISVLVLVGYLVVFGPTSDPYAAYSTQQELVLGIGSTLGIVAQLAVLVPFLRAAGVRYRPRFDLRGSGLGHTLRLATWTIGFIIVNQIAYTVVVRIASSGVAAGAVDDAGTGYTVYSQAFLLMMVPHSVATVSLATAILPRLSRSAAAGDLRAVGREVDHTLRTALTLILPFVLLLPVVAGPVVEVVYGWGAAAPNVEVYAPSLALFAPGLLFFTIHYLVLRGFYALEQTRTVFWVQCVVAGVNIAAAVAYTRDIDPIDTAPRLVLAYATAYLAGSVVSFLVLRRRTSGPEGPGVDLRGLTGAVGRMLAAAVPATAVAYAVRLGLEAWWGDDLKVAVVPTLATVALVQVLIFVVLGRRLRVAEVEEMVGLVARRLPARLRRAH
jgi:putative peptidoglycan lipid II flippase